MGNILLFNILILCASGSQTVARAPLSVVEAPRDATLGDSDNLLILVYLVQLFSVSDDLFCLRIMFFDSFFKISLLILHVTMYLCSM